MSDKIYVIVSKAGPIKVGISHNPEKRLRTLCQSQPFEAEIVHVSECPMGTARQIERAVHELLTDHHLRGEWFQVPASRAVEAITAVMANPPQPLPQRADLAYRAPNLTPKYDLAGHIHQQMMAYLLPKCEEEGNIRTPAEMFSAMLSDSVQSQRQRKLA